MPSDPLIRPADSAPSYRELRERFREENRQRICALLENRYIVTASCFGLEMLVRIHLRMVLNKEEREALKIAEDLIREFRAEGHKYTIRISRELKGRYLPGDELERVFRNVPYGLQEELARNADNCRLFTSASLPEGEGVDHDGPPIEDLNDEQQIFDAIDKLKDQSNEG